jgi:hypothetical protein
MTGLRRLTLALASLALLSGCSSNIVATAEAEADKKLTESLCASWREIRPSKKDRLSEATAVQILGNNEARQAWKCPAGDRLERLGAV